MLLGFLEVEEFYSRFLRTKTIIGLAITNKRSEE